MSPVVLRFAAFTDHGAGGNPAGVVLDARGLTEQQMLRIARDIGYSETAFVLPGPDPARAQVRYFSPLAEVAFCGHATVATAVALAERDGTGARLFETLAGPVAVDSSVTRDGVAATLTSPPTSTRPAAPEELSEALAALGWTREALDETFPAHVANAGNDHLVLAISSLEQLGALAYDYDKLAALMARKRWTTVHLFWAETRHRFHVRNAFPPGGVIEDPATGAAAAAFGGYLRALRLVELPAQLTLLQGQHMGAPSRLIVDVSPTAVQVTGTAHRMHLDNLPDSAVGIEPH